MTCSVPVEEEIIRIGKIEGEIANTMSYGLKLIVGARFMESSLSNLVNNLAEEIHKTKCKYGYDDEKY